MLGMLAIAVLFMGLYPAPFTDAMQISVADLLKHVAAVQAALTPVTEDDHMTTHHTP